MPDSIFISYKREDEAFARLLRDHLLQWGHRVWLDVIDIPSGAQAGTKGWDDAIHHGMKSSNVVLGVMTSASLASENVLDEWGWAISAQRRLFLLWLENISEEDIPPRYGRLQRIDLRDNLAHGLEKLRTAIDNPIKLLVEPVHSIPSDKPLTVFYAAHPTDTNRLRMLQKVEDYWIKGVLENTVQHNTPLDLALAPARTDTVLRHVDYGDYVLPNTTAIDQIFNEMNRELLILGAPGAGKTFTMLQLAQALISEARRDPRANIPVVFNLSSWAAGHKPIQHWLIDELRTTYQISRKVATTWVENGVILPLLDGLDEVAESLRESCVEAINSFRRLFPYVDLVVCSRIADYEILAQRLNLQGAVVLQPLSLEQIEHYLAAAELAGLREVIAYDATLQHMAETPFLLNTMAFAYRGMKGQVLSGYETPAERRMHVFDNYVERRLRLASPTVFTLHQTRIYLAWLARQMVNHAQTVFFIEYLQPDWLAAAWERHLYSLAIRLLIALPFLLPIIFLFYLANDLRTGSAVALGVLLFTGLLANRIYPQATTRVRLVDTLGWTWNTAFSGLATGLAIGAGTAFIFTNILYEGRINLLVTVIAGSLSFGAVGLVIGGLQSGAMQTRTRPNQGIWQSATYAAVLGSLFTVLISIGTTLVITGASSVIFGVSLQRMIAHLTGSVSQELITGTLIGFTIGSVLGLLFGGITVTQHVLLRINFLLHAKIPGNYARFLDYAVERGLLRKVGGGYIFIHRLLLEYFADLEIEKP